MPVRTDPWPAGTPCWTDIMVPDVARTSAFYAGLLGWSVGDPDPERGYTLATLDGHPVAGFAPAMPGMEEAPRAWAVYLATDDVAALGEAATAAGCETVVAPMPLGASGSMGMWIDPAGALFAAWQAGTLVGFGTYDVPGAPAWLDLTAPDVDVACELYGSLFPLAFTDGGPAGGRYAMFTPAGAPRYAGGIGQGGPGDPARWGVCFAVADLDDAATRIGDLGGTLVTEPFAVEHGRSLTAHGPDGEPFSLMSPA